MRLHQPSHRSLCGGVLAGTRRVRFVFMDESGNTAKEPVTVVAGVLVNGDTEWKLLAEHLDTIRETLVPPELRPGFIFHAQELFSGKAIGESWPPLQSWVILDELLFTIRRFHLPMSIGLVRRPDKDLGIQPNVRVQRQHMIAFLLCAGAANSIIRTYFPGEVGTIMAEDHKEMKKTLSQATVMLRKNPNSALRELLPFDGIVGAVNFAAKEDEPLLQLADAYSWAVRRFLSKLPEGKRLVHSFAGAALDCHLDSAMAYAQLLPWRPGTVPFEKAPSTFSLHARLTWRQRLVDFPWELPSDVPPS